MLIELPVDLLGKISEAEIKGGFFNFRMPFFVSTLVEGYGAVGSGIEVKDRIIGLNGKEIKYYDQFKQGVAGLNGQTVKVTVDRDGEVFNYDVKLSEKGIAYPVADGQVSNNTLCLNSNTQKESLCKVS